MLCVIVASARFFHNSRGADGEFPVRIHRILSLNIALAICAVLAWRTPVGAAEIQGAGATFPAPIYQRWAEAYRRATGDVVHYDAVGSGKGLELIREHRVDFGASDVPLSSAQLAESRLFEFPAVIGGVVPVVNLHGIGAGELKLSGELLSGIFLGRITRWNDPAIAEMNPSLHLPGSRITVVHRSDASGTSYLWTDYLSREDPRWKQDIGRGTSVPWPTGVAGVGNEGVASYVQRTRASLGYVECAYAEAHHLSDVSLRDASGAFIRADADAFAAALASAQDDASTNDATLLLTNTGRGWPIAGATFILIPTAAHDADTQRAVIDFFSWVLRDGQPLAREMHYVPIPEQPALRIVKELTARKP